MSAQLNFKAAGFSAGGIARLDALLGEFVRNGEVAGNSALILRKGEIAYLGCFGEGQPGIRLASDAIFRIYSMSKVFTSVAALTLFERGLFRLNDPVEKYIPSFANQKVAQTDARGVVTIVDAKRPVQIIDLMTMTSGIPYPDSKTFSSILMEELVERASADMQPWTTARIVDEVAALPLCFHPGEHWLYGFSTDVLGRIVEVLSGKSLGEYIAETITGPLELKDTGFFVPPGKHGRLCALYEPDASGAVTRSHAKDFYSDYISQPMFESGGGGMVSTLADITRFGQMLLGMGKLGDARILSRKTVQLMATDHLTPAQRPDYNWDSKRGYGYGIGVRVMVAPQEGRVNGSVGEWAWSGKAGTWFCIDPAEDMVAVYAAQRIPADNDNRIPRLMAAIYGAIDD